MQVNIPKGYSSEKYLFRKAFIPNSRYSEDFHPEGLFTEIRNNNHLG